MGYKSVTERRRTTPSGIFYFPANSGSIRQGTGRTMGAKEGENMKKEQKSEFLSTRVRYIPINDILPNPQQPRRRFDQEGLQELADSIRAYGILQPVTVRAQGDGYERVAGERRWRAARIAGLRQVPCLLARVDEEDAALLALIENLQRRDLDYMEEAAAIARLVRRYGLSQQQAAEKLGRSQSAVANKLRLLRLEEPVVEALHRYGLTERHARALLRLEDGEQRLTAAEHIGKRQLNVAAAEEYIERLLAQNQATPPKGRSAYIIKDVRLFLNSVERGIRLMRTAGVGAKIARQDTEEEICLTVRIPRNKKRPA